MTPTPEGKAPDLISTGVQTLVDTSTRLGLTWQLRLATVTSSIDSDRMRARVDGDEAVVTVTSVIGAVSPGDRVYVVSIPPAGNYAIGFAGVSPHRQIFNIQTSASTSVSTVYANLSNIAGTAFTAPGSGIVTIHYTARLGNTLATGGAAITPWIGVGSTVGAGTQVLAASDANALIYLLSTAAEDIRMGGHHTISGLEPGLVYNVSMQGRMVTGGTASFDDITTTVVPSP
jgi:hypothetical protein